MPESVGGASQLCSLICIELSWAWREFCDKSSFLVRLWSLAIRFSRMREFMASGGERTKKGTSWIGLLRKPRWINSSWEFIYSTDSLDFLWSDVSSVFSKIVLLEIILFKNSASTTLSVDFLFCDLDTSFPELGVLGKAAIGSDEVEFCWEILMTGLSLIVL